MAKTVVHREKEFRWDAAQVDVFIQRVQAFDVSAKNVPVPREEAVELGMDLLEAWRLLEEWPVRMEAVRASNERLKAEVDPLRERVEVLEAKLQQARYEAPGEPEPETPEDPYEDEPPSGPLPRPAVEGQDLTIRQVAERLGFHPDTVRQAARDGRLEGAYQLGRGWRMPPESVEKVRKVWRGGA